jgi:putative ABC transport system permease protein
MPPANMVVNLAAARAFGFSTARQALGQTIRQGAGKGGSLHRIVGVTDNLRFGSPRAQVSPTVYFLRGQGIPTAVAAIRYESRNWGALSARLQDSWRSVAPEIPFRAETVASSLQPYYQADDQRTRLFGAAAVLALGVACLGLFGLAASAAERRRHEIGIRKTLGASAADVGRLLIAQFLRPVLIANLIAWPLAYLAMRHYLAGFDQRVALRPVYFLAAAALTLAVAVLTVVAQTLRVARAEPAKTLRYD